MIFDIRGIVNLICMGCILIGTYGEDVFWVRALGLILIAIGMILNTISLFYE